MPELRHLPELCQSCADLELCHRMRHFRVQNGPFVMNKFFWYKPLLLISSTYWPFLLCKILKNSYSGSRVMRMRNFWDQNDPFSQMIFIFRKPVNEPCFFHSCISICQKLKSDINLLVRYWQLKNTWNLIGREPFLAITWEQDFSQVCSFRRMLMNHKNFDFTQIPDKPNDAIFLNSPKTMFWGYFWLFLVIFAQWGFFPKNSGLSHATIHGPLTPC